jgi:hypothetical protein
MFWDSGVSCLRTSVAYGDLLDLVHEKRGALKIRGPMR